MSKPIIHIVAFAYKPDTPTSYKSSLAASFLALKAECVSEKDGRNYIKSMTAGKQNSPEGAHLGFEHTFVLTFASLSERDYYLDQDQAHQRFKRAVKEDGWVEKVFVSDFEDGEF